MADPKAELFMHKMRKIYEMGMFANLTEGELTENLDKSFSSNKMKPNT